MVYPNYALRLHFTFFFLLIVQWIRQRANFFTFHHGFFLSNFKTGFQQKQTRTRNKKTGLNEWIVNCNRLIVFIFASCLFFAFDVIHHFTRLRKFGQFETWINTSNLNERLLHCIHLLFNCIEWIRFTVYFDFFLLK